MESPVGAGRMFIPNVWLDRRSSLIQRPGSDCGRQVMTRGHPASFGYIGTRSAILSGPEPWCMFMWHMSRR